LLLWKLVYADECKVLLLEIVADKKMIDH